MSRKAKKRVTKKRHEPEDLRYAVKPWIGAAIIGGSPLTERYARVPIDFDGITPSVPTVLQVEKEFFILIETNPLRYRVATFKKGTPLARL